MNTKLKKSLDDPTTTLKRIKILRNKQFLYKTYLEFYNLFKKHSKELPRGSKVEIGSGAGFLKEIIPDVTTSDILPLKNCDMVFKAEKIPFKTNSVAAFYLLDTFHHIKDPLKALYEMQRCLKKNGKIIMIEPANTFASRILYKYFHHENFDTASSWFVKGDKPLSDANGAMAWIIFKRDNAKFIKLFPKLKLKKFEDHLMLGYILSGGFSLPQLIPNAMAYLYNVLNIRLKLLDKLAGMFTIIILQKE